MHLLSEYEAYNHVRERSKALNWTGIKPKQIPPKLYATKGASTSGKSISSKPSYQDVNLFDRVIKRGVRLYLIGTDTAKNLFHGRLQLNQQGSGYIHLSKYLPEMFFQHITNEVRVIKHTTKGDVSVWQPRRAGVRNECLDCTVMTLFCAHKTALHRKTQTEWNLLESIVQPNQRDLFFMQVRDKNEDVLISQNTTAYIVEPAKKSVFNEVKPTW